MGMQDERRGLVEMFAVELKARQVSFRAKRPKDAPRKNLRRRESRTSNYRLSGACFCSRSTVHHTASAGATTTRIECHSPLRQDGRHFHVANL